MGGRPALLHTDLRILCTKIGYHQRVGLRFQLFGKSETQAVSWTPNMLHMWEASVLQGLPTIWSIMFSFVGYVSS